MKQTWLWIGLAVAALLVTCTLAKKDEKDEKDGNTTVATTLASTDNSTDNSTDVTGVTSSGEVTGTSSPETEGTTQPPYTGTGTSTAETDITTSTPEISTKETTDQVTSETSTAGGETPPPDEPKCTGRSFDAWSFIGGMILVGVVVIITFFAWKYYKSRTEQRYHQF